MVAKQAFIDESARSGYLVCAVVLATGDATPTRRALQGLRKSGQRRIHMATESPSRRREILSAVADLKLESYLYLTPRTRISQRRARDACLRAAVPQLIDGGAARLVLESCDQDRQDRQIIAEMLQKSSGDQVLRYEHARPAAEPLLWLPDIIAWAYGKGSDWRRRVAPIVTKTARIQP